MPIELTDPVTASLTPLRPLSGAARWSLPAQPAGAPLTHTRGHVMRDVLSRHLRASALAVAPVRDAETNGDASLAPQGPFDSSQAPPTLGTWGTHQEPPHLHVLCAPFTTDDGTLGPQDLLARAEPEALRYLLLQTHYREPLALTVETDTSTGTRRFPQLARAEAQLVYLYATKRRLQALPEARIIEVEWPSPSDIESFEDALVTALDADLNTPLALRSTTNFLSAVNALCDLAASKKGKVARAHVDDARKGFATLAGRLGLGLEEPTPFLHRVRNRKAAERGISTEFVESKIRERVAARAERDFATADGILHELRSMGVEMLDAAEGTAWTIVSPGPRGVSD